MYKYLAKYLIFIFLCLTLFAKGQHKLDGYYIRFDTTYNVYGTITSIKQESLLLKKDSIWHKINSFDTNNRRLDTGFLFCKGTFRKYKKKEFVGFLIVMECDTCPKFWKYTTKPKDSIGLNIMKLSDDIDTVIKGSDTTFVTYEIVSDKSQGRVVERIREYFFKQIRHDEILFEKFVFRRQRQKL